MYEVAVFSKGGVTYRELNEVFTLPEAIKIIGMADGLSKKMVKERG